MAEMPPETLEETVERIVDEAFRGREHRRQRARTFGAVAAAGGRGDYWYLVLTDGTTHTVYDRNGTVVHSGTVAATEINWALANLTVGRAYKQRVAVVGSYTIAAPIVVPSYAMLDLTGARLYLANTSACNMIQNSAPVAGNTEIEIVGGTLDGNKANQASGHGIFFDDVQRSTVRNCHIISCKEDGIKLTSTDERTYNVINNNMVEQCNSYGIEVLANCHRTQVLNNECFSNGTGAHAGIYLSANFCIIQGNHCSDNTYIGIQIDTNWEALVDGNNCHNNSYYGIYFGATSGYGVISNNICHVNDRHGIYIRGVSHTIIGNNSYNNSENNVNLYDDIRVVGNYMTVTANIVGGMGGSRTPKYGIYVEGNYNTITANTCDLAGTDGIQLFNCLDCTVSENAITGAAGSGVATSGTTDYIVIIGNALRGNATAITEAGVDTNNKIAHNMGDATHEV